MKAYTPFLLLTSFLLLVQACTPVIGPDQVATGVAGTLTALPSPTSPATNTPALTVAPAPTDTPKPAAPMDPSPTSQPSPPPDKPPNTISEPAAIEPYPDAPLCVDTRESHDNSLFHTLWDGKRGCHYDHEHGQYPFTPQVVAAFPGFDLQALIGGVGVGHTNPSSPMENTHKHAGFKWDVVLSHSTGCEGKEGAPTGVDAMVVQYHGFGDYSIEFESRIHSAAGLLRQCRTDAPTDYGYIFANQFQDYGQRTAPYQGVVLPYPDTPNAVYDAGLKPYFFIECTGGIRPCDKYPVRQDFLDRGEANSIWTSESDHLEGEGPRLFAISFSVRDTYQILDWNDQVHPFTLLWLCSSDGGLTFDQAACHYNNSTTQIVEVAGTIPEAWDNLEGFDADSSVGRITAEGYVTRFGDLNQDCTEPGPDCHPLKLVGAFTGRYGSFIVSTKFGTTDPPNLPERDIYFCGEELCAPSDPRAVPSGWIGQNN